MEHKVNGKSKQISDEELEQFRNEEYPKMIKRLKQREIMQNKVSENKQEN